MFKYLLLIVVVAVAGDNGVHVPTWVWFVIAAVMVWAALMFVIDTGTKYNKMKKAE